MYILEAFTADDLKNIVNRALEQDEWLRNQGVTIQEWEALIQLSGGDGRRILNLLELVVQSLPAHQRDITNNKVQQIVQRKMALYDKSGEQHYDIISAFINR